MSNGTDKRRRTHVVGVRMTDDERESIVGKARDCGLTVSAFFRACALGRKTRNATTSRVLDELTKLGNEQRRIGGLIKHLRFEGALSPAERVGLMQQVEAAQRAVVNAISKIADAG